MKQFIKEDSNNDKIPELSRIKSKLAVFLIGPPASGKTTFYHQYIQTKNNTFKYFSSDAISDILKKYKFELSKIKNIENTKNQRYDGSSKLLSKYMAMFLNTQQNFVYDTTGFDSIVIRNFYNLAKMNDYTVIFIYVLSPRKEIIRRNLNRNRQVDSDYINKNYEDTKNKINNFKILKPNSFYLVKNLNGYEFFKLENDKFHRIKQ